MKIQEVAQQFDVTASTLRYYEQIGLLSPVPRVNGQRQYSQLHLEQVHFVTCMKKTGLSLEDIQEYVRLYELGTETKQERSAVLQKQKEATLAKIQELQEVIKYIDMKLSL